MSAAKRRCGGQLRRAATLAFVRFTVAVVVVLICRPAAGAPVTCTISTTSLNFGTAYNVFASTPTDSLATVTYNCNGSPFPNAGVPIRITLSAGNSANFLDRIFNGPDLLHYNLYQDAPRTMVWGDTAAYDLDRTIAKTNKGVNLTVSIYGRVPALQDVTSGSYSDSITVTVIY